MKGIVFTSFADMVEEVYGIDMWEKLLAKARPASKGIYIAGETYPDKEMNQLLDVLVKQLDEDAVILLKIFGEYLFQQLTSRYPQFVEAENNFLNFLKSIQDVIHVDVKKLYQNATVPIFSYRQESESVLIMDYFSSRQLCALAEGLIQGAAKAYGADYTLDHQMCTHRGDAHCRFRIEVI